MEASLIIVAIGLLLLCSSYFYWRFLAITFKSNLVAYDILVASAVVSWLMFRIAAVFVDTSFRLGNESVWGELFSPLNVNLVYVVGFFIPLIVQELFARKRRVNVKAYMALLWGGSVVLGIELFQLGQSILSNWPSVFTSFHIARIVVLIALCLLALYWRSRAYKWGVNLLLIMFSLGMYVCFFPFPVTSVNEISATGVVLVVFGGGCLLLTNLKKSKSLPVNQEI